MSVEGAAIIRRRPTGLDVPYPESIWYGQGAAIGDVGGGFIRITFTFNAGGVIRSGRSWSIETWLADTTEDTTRSTRLLTINFDILGPGLIDPINRSMAMLVRNTGLADNPSSASEPANAHPQLYLGAQAGTATTARVEVVYVNTNAETFSSYLSGYEWGPGAMALGVRRPPEGLFAL